MDFSKQISPVKAARKPKRPPRHKIITTQDRSFQQRFPPAAARRPIHSYCRERSAKDPLLTVPRVSLASMWAALKDREALGRPEAPEDAVVLALMVADSALAGLVLAEAAGRFLAAAVEAAVAEANSAAEAAAVFSASK